jgi:cytoskeletal protein CcmA (bactofilin family)
MARKAHDDALGVAGAETIIGTGVVVHGNLESQSDITVDGTLDGLIKAEGNVTIGINAIIKGNVDAINVTVAGNLNGDINATGEASILESGQVKGNIKSAGLSISPGGVFIGRSIMEQPLSLEPEAPEDPQPEAAKRRRL